MCIRDRISCTTVCILIPVPESSPEKKIPNTEPRSIPIRQITIMTKIAIQPPAAIAAINAFVPAIIALTASAIAFAIAFAVTTAARAAARAA